MLKLVRVIVAALLLGLSGCEQLKGDKGDKGAKGDTGSTGASGNTGANGADGQDGTSTLLSTKAYTGTPATNPYSVTCPEITNADNQIVQVFMVLDSYSKTPLPYTTYGASHGYLIGAGGLSLATIGVGVTPSPSVALYDPAWYQCSYRIEIRTFATASAAQSYKSQRQRTNLSSSYYNQLIYGEEIK